MGICANCDKPIEGKRQTCSDRCRQALRRATVTETVTDKNCDKPTVTRRGKDITNFEHLPPDVQGTIIRLTTNQDGTVDEQARTNRTAIAIDYQHKRPDRYYSTGIGGAS